MICLDIQMKENIKMDDILYSHGYEEPHSSQGIKLFIIVWIFWGVCGLFFYFSGSHKFERLIKGYKKSCYASYIQMRKQ